MELFVDVDVDVWKAEVRGWHIGLWLEVATKLAKIWHERHNLQRLKIILKDRHSPSATRDAFSARWGDNPDMYVRCIMQPFTALSRVKRVTIEGDLPAWYMRSPEANIKGEPGLLQRRTIETIKRILKC